MAFQPPTAHRIYIDISVGGRGGALGKLAEESGLKLAEFLEAGISICVLVEEKKQVNHSAT